MRKITQFIRLVRISYILSKQGVDDIVLNTPTLSHLSFLAYLNPWNWHGKKLATRGERLRLAFEELGPVFIKFGQLLSTRRDLIPADIALELAHLQDNVPPFPGELAMEMIAKELGQPIDAIFSEFQINALASASIAQVHLATLHNGAEVVVKVLRPHVEKMIRRDIALLYTFAALFKRFYLKSKKIRLHDAVAEFERDTLAELDLLREASNASQLRRNFSSSHELYVPEIHWNYCRERVMVMERIHGVSISDIDTLQLRGVNLKKLAERGVEIFFTQIFRDCFFHADMHPGNIFVSTKNPRDPQYIVVDFGIMGTLSQHDQRYLAENLLAFFKRDYRKVAELHVASGWVPATTRIDAFESAIRTVCEPIFEKPLKDISAGQMLLRLIQTAQAFHMEIQPQLILLQKTLIAIEGLGRHLYPELDLWSTAKPFMERWMNQQLGPRAFLKQVRANAPMWLEKLPDLPELIYQSLKKNIETPTYPQPNPPVPIKEQPIQKNKSSVFFSISSLSFFSALALSILFTSPNSKLGVVVLGTVGLVTLLSAWLCRK